MDGKGASSVSAKAVDREVPIERDRFVHAETLHHRPTGPIDNREGLIRKLWPDCCGHLKIGEDRRFDSSYAGANRIHELLGNIVAQPAGSEGTMSRPGRGHW